MIQYMYFSIQKRNCCNLKRQKVLKFHLEGRLSQMDLQNMHKTFYKKNIFNKKVVKNLFSSCSIQYFQGSEK